MMPMCYYFTCTTFTSAPLSLIVLRTVRALAGCIDRPYMLIHEVTPEGERRELGEQTTGERVEYE